ncbi:AraC family ligand binding domain-containing protein [Rhodovibrionaceae bacterium A322]
MSSPDRHNISQKEALSYRLPSPDGVSSGGTDLWQPNLKPCGTVDPEGFGKTDVAHFWRASRYGDMECLNARYRKHSYALHTHDTYAIGLITECAESFYYRGEQRVAGAGQIVIVEPGEPHNGKPDNDIFSYRMYYPSPELFSDLLTELTGQKPGYLFFPDSVVDDPILAERLFHLHQRLQGSCSLLEADGEFLGTMGQLALRHADQRLTPSPLGRERKPIRRVRDYLDAHASQEVDLEQLADLAGFSRYHLLRAFRKEVGVTPQVYQTDKRVALARELLCKGQPLSQVAQDCGFFDQAHFSRAFKQRVGVTPGHYQRAHHS